MSEDPVLKVRDLNVRFRTKHGVAHVVRGMSYDVYAGRTLAIVGESGSGKSVSTLALTRLVPSPPAEVDGSVRLGDVDVLDLDERGLERVRGRRIGYVFQDPMTSLNPVHPIGRQLTEGLVAHLGMSDRDARARAVQLLDQVGIPGGSRRLDDYPHQFSGGMRQRVVIAIGLACDPDVLVADEATTALDVTTQAQIIDLVAGLQQELGMGVIWITHDLGVVAGIADRILVMYAGQVVEAAGADTLFSTPRHPYTAGLLSSVPVLGNLGREDLATIPGLPPSPLALPPGCAFYPRCAVRDDARCADEPPPLAEVAPGHEVRAFYTLSDDASRAAGTSPGAAPGDGQVA